MRHFVAIVVLTACFACAACGGTTTSPSAVTSSGGTISFVGQTGNGASVTTYTQFGFTVSAMSGDWSSRTD